jgi:DNA-binding transcriptional LysR family regulator
MASAHAQRLQRYFRIRSREQHGSFTAAAKALDVPKTRVSRKVQELELRLGSLLLKRSTRRLGLTEAGRVYFERCAPVIGGLEDAEHAVAILSSRPQGTSTLTAPFWLASGVLAPLLAEFNHAYPDVQIKILATNEPMDLVSGDVDLALRLWIGDLPTSQLTVRRLGGLPMQVHASCAYLAHHVAP